MVQEQARTPALFSQIRQPAALYLALSEVSSSRRLYIPSCYLEHDVIAGNKLVTITNAPPWLFGVLHSSMWMSWVRSVIGRLKSDYSIAPSLAYNAFPFIAAPTGDKLTKVDAGAQDILDQRAKHSSASLATLYDPLSMPANLSAAHDNSTV